MIKTNPTRDPANHRTLVIGWLIFASLSLVGCATPNSGTQPGDAFPRYHDRSQWPDPPLKPLQLETQARISLPAIEESLEETTEAARYSFVISNMDVGEGLRMFARAYDLNVSIDRDVTGILDVEFNDVPLAQALSVMLDSLDYYWEIKQGVIRVRSQKTQIFDVDYLRLIRGGTGFSTATVSSASAEGGAGGDSSSGGDSDSGSVSISQEDEIHFWSELDNQLRGMLSANGRLVINRLAGTIQVSDQHAYVSTVANYLQHIKRAIHRQVDIEVRILEVALDDTTALGINWSRVSNIIDSGVNVDFSIDGTISNPAGGLNPLANVLTLRGANIKNDGDQRIGAVIDALSQQGDVEIVSQPHIRTLNNQTSLIKVGTDRTFFRREQSIDSTSAGSITTATDVPQVVTEGVVLSITPQISKEGWVMMDVSPVVTRVSSVSVVEGANGQILSSAPNLDVAQVSSLIRARSGDTVVIGGLIQSQTTKTYRGLPGTRRLGAAGKLLGGGKYEATTRKELIMVLTPTIVHEPS